jgi:hypothetical protein
MEDGFGFLGGGGWGDSGESVSALDTSTIA